MKIGLSFRQYNKWILRKNACPRRWKRTQTALIIVKEYTLITPVSTMVHQNELAFIQWMKRMCHSKVLITVFPSGCNRQCFVNSSLKGSSGPISSIQELPADSILGTALLLLQPSSLLTITSSDPIPLSVTLCLSHSKS